MWLAQFVCAPQFFKPPKGLCGHTVYYCLTISEVSTLIFWISRLIEYYTLQKGKILEDFINCKSIYLRVRSHTKVKVLNTTQLPLFIYFHTNPDDDQLRPKHVAYWKQNIVCINSQLCDGTVFLFHWCLGYFFVLFPRVRLRFPRDTFPQGFPTKILYAFLISPCRTQAPPHPSYPLGFDDSNEHRLAIPVAARSKASVFGRALTGIAGSNPA